ncbi:uncharacterized protein K452DRAFT_243621 [Aplosporella prunicola CBS 121167]|uniref:Ubiquitin-conjugating enzyme E2 2 n=1 Tax=Aplosporella prunicola CBS 121167 TaxID=1176127 RepID=A0A6A6BQK3_9PEZI|nr:uncharacterized protein K452DRAFT_243621 [Aplosporella prunicola CBS 121167]KAF2145524.1 hypothetical protein K452DRAFT_243621 [Aplosporella prunicola CBS 121167]
MNSKSLRRLASDHATLHSNLPPNYLFPANADSDDLTQLDILLAGPEGTPYSAGLYKLHLEIPSNYPTAPPTAHFRTRIWHPNVEEATGAVCVDTLKRDWQSTLTLRHVLVTISCLLIQPNPASALNAEAGALLQEDWNAFVRRAKLMTGIHAQVPRDLRTAVDEAKVRGEDRVPPKEDNEKKADVTKSAVRTNTKGKGKMAVEKVVAQEEENQELARTVSEDWIPAPAFVTPIGTNAYGPRPMVTNSHGTEGMEVDGAAAQIPSTPLASIQAPGASFNASMTGSVHTPVFAQQACYQTPQRIPNPTIPAERPLSRSSSQSSASSHTVADTTDWALRQAPYGKFSAEDARRQRHENRRLKAAGYCLKRYNRGAFGPRTGLRRL